MGVSCLGRSVRVSPSIIPFLFTQTHKILLYLVVNSTSGQEKVGPLRDGYYEGADAAIIMFDVQSCDTMKGVEKWHQDIVRVCGDGIPIVIVANKIEDKDNRTVKTAQVKYPLKKKLQYYEVSVKSKENLEMPILYIAKKLSNKQHLRLEGRISPVVDGMEIDS